MLVVAPGHVTKQLRQTHLHYQPLGQDFSGHFLATKKILWDVFFGWSFCWYQLQSQLLILHPGRLTWNLKITQLKRKIIFQTIIFRFHVNLSGCNHSWFWLVLFDFVIEYPNASPKNGFMLTGYIHCKKWSLQPVYKKWYQLQEVGTEKLLREKTTTCSSTTSTWVYILHLVGDLFGNWWLFLQAAIFHAVLLPIGKRPWRCCGGSCPRWFQGPQDLVLGDLDISFKCRREEKDRMMNDDAVFVDSLLL